MVKMKRLTYEESQLGHCRDPNKTVAVQAEARRLEELGHFEPKQGTIKVEHESGFIFMDLEGFNALPKSNQTKILKLGGN